ncbi:hypothetical protein V5799_011299 [Amblyomma americanum]|uniref:Uncharacterized protein n=1 Tax=Amblyomma americanum TaxID=6943 RepID=A0AAQ4EHB4_AMBAM
MDAFGKIRRAFGYSASSRVGRLGQDVDIRHPSASDTTANDAKLRLCRIVIKRVEPRSALGRLHWVACCQKPKPRA